MRIVAIVVSLGITAVAVALAVVAVQRMLAVIRAGQPAIGRTDNPGPRTVNMLKETLLHTRMLQWHWIGVMHWFVFAGFIFLSSMVFGAYFQIFDAHAALPIIGHWVIYEWPAELLSWLTLIGILYLIFVRQKNHPRRLDRKSRFFGSTFWQAYFVEAVIFLVVLCGFILRTLEYALEKAHDADGLTFHYPLTFFLGDMWGGLSVGTLENLVYLIAMIKLVISMTWLITIARNITMGVAWHRFTAWFNIYFKRESDGGTALGGLNPIIVKGAPLDLENMDDLEEEDFSKLGVGQVEDFTWKGLLDFTTCTECGRCQSQCPAWNTEKPLSPKLLVMGLRDHAYAKIPHLGAEEGSLSETATKELERPLIGDADSYGVIDPDVLWSCTNCGACVQQCPVDIEHVDHIIDMRRYQVLVESNFPSELNNIFKGLERKGNPWNMDPRNRMDWAKGLDFEVKQVGRDIEDLDSVEWLFWVGCAGAYEDRAKKTTQAVAELLHTAGVTFGVLGDGETCTGDPARRAGNEIVFAQLAMQNAEVFKETKVKKVVSTCAHCFNTLKNEYAEFGVELEVVHHTQLLNRLVREGKLTPVAPTGGEVEGKTITYHDPCFLGRHNQVYEPPRELLSVIPGATFKEMPRNSEKSFCCGAGGARMWMEETIGSRINVNRTEEAIATGADQIAVGCPFCRVMLSDGLTLKQSEGEAREEVEVLDVAQMLLASIKRAPVAEPEPEPEVEAEVVAEAVAATAGAVAAEPVEQLDEPQTGGEDDKAVAAKSNIAVDDEGKRTGEPVEPEGGPVEPASASESRPDDSEELPAEEIVPAKVEEPTEEDAREEEVGATTESVAPESEPDAEPAPTNMSAEEKAAAAEANVGPVASGPAEPKGDEESPAEEIVPEKVEEPTDEAAREEEVDTTTDDIVAVEDAPSPDPVAEDVAPLTNASPSSADVSDRATELSTSADGDEAEDKPEASKD